MEVYTERLDGPRCSVFFVGDIHEGNCNHDETAMTRAVNIIKDRAKERPVVTVLMGDMIDAITHTGDPRFSPTELSDHYTLDKLKDLPRLQMRQVVNRLKPIADTIKYALVGNHEEQYIKRHSFDCYAYLCDDLLPSCHKLGYMGMVRILADDHGKRRAFTVALTHGSGGGGFKVGYPLNLVTDTFQWVDADCYVMGHVHKLFSKRIDLIGVDKMGQMTHRPKFYGISGCLLQSHVQGHRNYFEGKRGTPSEIGMLEMQIETDAREDHKTALLEHRL